MGLLAVSKIIKQEGVYKLLQEGDSEKCLKMCEFLSLIVCSLILVEKWRLILTLLTMIKQSGVKNKGELRRHLHQRLVKHRSKSSVVGQAIIEKHDTDSLHNSDNSFSVLRKFQ